MLERAKAKSPLRSKQLFLELISSVTSSHYSRLLLHTGEAMMACFSLDDEDKRDVALMGWRGKILGTLFVSKKTRALTIYVLNQ